MMVVRQWLREFRISLYDVASCVMWALVLTLWWFSWIERQRLLERTEQNKACIEALERSLHWSKKRVTKLEEAVRQFGDKDKHGPSDTAAH